MHGLPTQGAAARARRVYARRPVKGRVGQIRDVSADDSDEWLAALRGPPAVRDAALVELHALLVRGARYELGRRRASLGHVPSSELEDLAQQAADDALVAILAKLDSFRRASRFTTWAYKFVLLEAGVKARRRAWHGRETPLDDHAGPIVRDTRASAQSVVESAELLRAVSDAVSTALTPHQREVFCALALNDVPIDVLAERLGTTRGALYKTLHDARRKIRATLAERGFAIATTTPLGGGRVH